MYDIAIIGGGIAGLTAAIYGQRAGKSTVVFEKMSFGGQIVNSPMVENYPGIATISGSELTTRLLEQATGLGAETVQAEVLGVEKQPLRFTVCDRDCNKKPAFTACDRDHNKQPRFADYDRGGDEEASRDLFRVRTAKEVFECRSVVLAGGMERRLLGVSGEERLKGAGVSYCATCDGMFFKGRDVAVVGGGNTALEDAEFLSEYCKKVYLVHRRDTFRGEEGTVRRLAEKENVEFVLDTVVEEILGGQAVEGIRLCNKKEDEHFVLNVSGVFVAVGQIPKNEPFASLVKLDEAGFVVAGEDGRTSVPGIFAAGDCRMKHVRQLTTAAADGTVAALAAVAWVNGGFSLTDSGKKFPD